MSLTFLQRAASTSDLTTYTFSSQNLGTASAGRYIIVCVESRTVTLSTTINSVTVGGVSATIVRQGFSNGSSCTVAGIAYALVPSGTTGDVVVTFSAGMVRCGIQLFSATGIDFSATVSEATSKDVNPLSASLNVPAGGIAIGCAANVQTAATWTGLTERSDEVIETTSVYTSAGDSFGTTQTGLSVTCNTGGTVAPVGIFASWGPAAASFIDNTQTILNCIGGGLL